MKQLRAIIEVEITVGKITYLELKVELEKTSLLNQVSTQPGMLRQSDPNLCTMSLSLSPSLFPITLLPSA